MSTLSKEEILGKGKQLYTGNGGEVEMYLKEHCFVAMDEYAEQETIGFFKWYGVKMAPFIEYITKIKPLVESYEIEEKIKEFEGKPVSALYQLYLKSKEK